MEPAASPATAEPAPSAKEAGAQAPTEGRADGTIKRGTKASAAQPTTPVAAAAEGASPATAGPPALSPRAQPSQRTWLGFLLTLVAIGAVVALLGLSAWLYKPMSKAWNNKRAVDHPSENTFDLGKGECVQPQCPALGVCRQAPRTTHPKPHTPRIPTPPRTHPSLAVAPGAPFHPLRTSPRCTSLSLCPRTMRRGAYPRRRALMT